MQFFTANGVRAKSISLSDGWLTDEEIETVGGTCTGVHCASFDGCAADRGSICVADECGCGQNAACSLNCE
jgi:hypothetical protein